MFGIYLFLFAAEPICGIYLFLFGRQAAGIFFIFFIFPGPDLDTYFFDGGGLLFCRVFGRGSKIRALP